MESKTKAPKHKPMSGMFAHSTGQWRKDIWNSKLKRSIPYYFGSWHDDPEGVRAVAEYYDRKEAIASGTDQAKIVNLSGDATLPELAKEYLAARLTDAAAMKLSRLTYGDYLQEITWFKEWVAEKIGPNVKVRGLTPAHFAAFTQHILTKRKLGPDAEKRVKAAIKTMFRWGASNGHCPLPMFGTAFAAPSTTPEAKRKWKARNGIADNSKRIVTGAEIDALLEQASPLYKGIILVMVNCGLGPADIGRLRWKHLNLETGMLDMPRGKNFNERHGYVWKRTRKALARVRTLKYNKLRLEKEGDEALVFVTRKNRPLYVEKEVVREGRVTDVRGESPVGSMIHRLAGECKPKIKGVSAYRLRHTFKTLGKKAKDRDALNLMMGHKEGTIAEVYDHEEIGPKRVKRVAVTVKKMLWPKPKHRVDETDRGQPKMRLVGSAAA